MSRGVRLETKVEILPREVTLRPLRDQIVVKPLDWKPSKTIEIAGNKRKTLCGIVTAVGPGAYLRHYYYRTLPDGRRERYAVKETDKRVPIQVKVGDRVELGGLSDEDGDYDGYAFQEIVIGTEKHVICQEKDVVGIHG